MNYVLYYGGFIIAALLMLAAIIFFFLFRIPSVILYFAKTKRLASTSGEYRRSPTTQTLRRTTTNTLRNKTGNVVSVDAETEILDISVDDKMFETEEFSSTELLTFDEGKVMHGITEVLDETEILPEM